VDISDSHSGTDRAGRRCKRFLTPAQTYEIWVLLLRGQDHDRCCRRPGGRRPLPDPQAAHRRKAGRAGGAGPLRAGSASRPGGSRAGSRPRGDRQAVRGGRGDGRAPDAGRRIWALGLSGRIPRRVDQAAKAGLLELIDRGYQGRLGSPPVSVGRWSWPRPARGGGARRIGRPAATPSTACGPRRRPRSWRCSTSGPRSTALTASWPTAARI
jgi:hypothetical protein